MNYCVRSKVVSTMLVLSTSVAFGGKQGPAILQAELNYMETAIKRALVSYSYCYLAPTGDEFWVNF